MSDKIIVEDHTKPADKETLIDSLANTLALYAVSLGKGAGLSKEEIVAASIQTAEEMVLFLLSIGAVSEEEIVEIRKKAIKNAEERTKDLKKAGLADLARKVQAKSNG